MGEKKEYLTLDKLKAYQLSRELSREGWEIFEQLHWTDKRTMGFQFIESTDSVGANTAEGFGRYHYLDKAKFYLNSRGSLLESRHRFDLLCERGKIKEESQRKYLDCFDKLRVSLGGLIKSTHDARARSLKP